MKQKINIESLVRNNLKDLTPYSSARSEHGFSDGIYLDANENPYPSGYNRYPDPFQIELKSTIAEIKKVEPNSLFLGNGSDEAIDLLIRLFCRPGEDNILITDPTYSMYKICAQINDIDVKKVKLNDDFSLNQTKLLNAVNQNTKLIFLCSPNNPSGNLLEKRALTEIIENFNGVVIVDEAYIDFCPESSLLSSLEDHENLILLQTLSKARGLAGIRLGIAVGNPAIITYLNKIKPPYNIPGPVQEIALTSLKKDSEIIKNRVSEILKERVILMKKLRELSIVEYIHPSDANFILVKFRDSVVVYESLKNSNILVRDRSNETHCDNCLRITVGKPEENKKLLAKLEKISKS